MTWLETHYLWFVFYSMVGWIWEEIVCSIPAKKFINRGFLNGPYLPIYGSGALLVILLLSDIHNPVALFLVGALVTGILEYVTSWVMEKLFHARWWDYSECFLNINGRVCFRGAVAFGTLSVIAVHYVHPFVVSVTDSLPALALSILSLGLFALMLSDLVYTLTAFSGFEAKLQELASRIGEAAAAITEQPGMLTSKLRDGQIHKFLEEAHQDLYKRINNQERRLLKAFPKLRSVRYNDALDHLREHLRHITEELKEKRSRD